MLDTFQNYVFDLDGTIINSSHEVLLCFKKAFEKSNYIIPQDRFNSNVIGPPLRQILALIAPELKDENIISDIIKNFRQIYDYDENDVSVLYEGMLEILQLLKSKSKRLFIATFKPEIPTQRIIKQFKLNMFEDIYTIDKSGKSYTKDEMILDIIKKHNLKKKETVMIGDAPSDIIAGKKAGVYTAGVLWGYGSDKKELIKNADIVLEYVKDFKWKKLNLQII